MIISLFWSDYLGDSLVGLVYFLPPLAIYIIAFCYFSGKEGLLKILLASLASSLVPVFITLYQIIHKQYFFSPDSNLGRLQGPFNHPNLLGLHIFVIIALFISYYLAKEDKKISHNLFIILYNLILLAILVLTYSRVSWACLGLFLLILVYIRRNLIALFIAFSPVAAILAISIKNIRLRIIETFSGSLFSSWSARLNIWKISFSEIVKRPIFGNGIGTSEKIIEQAKSWQGGTIRPHNDLVLYGLELGIIGIIIFFAYTIGIIYYCRKTFICLNNKYETVQIYNKKFIINFKILSFGIMAIFLSLLLANGFEAISRRIVTQIVVWAILGCLFSLKISEKKYAK
ncbi:MAG: O-antigen ligase family protein [Patescibacteria group bacterium]